MAARLAMFAPFAVRSYRYQWLSDLLSSSATEMEIIVLGWFILVETESVALLALFGALQYFGTLIAPGFGLVGDRIGHRNVILAMRVGYALLATLILLRASNEWLSAISALLVAAVAGMMRPSDLGIRNVLTSQMVSTKMLMSAISLSRITMDTARIGGALGGATVVASFGLQGAYVLIIGLYATSAMLAAGIGNVQVRSDATARFTPLKDFIEAIRALRAEPAHLAAMILAFLVNLAAYPFTLGLLPYIAREVYGADQTTLSYMVAATGIGAMVGALLLSYLGQKVRPARTMLVFSVVWHLLIVLFALIPNVIVGLILLMLIGASSMLCLLPLSVMLLQGVKQEYLGRIMGIRMQAVYGLPLGLLLAGPLIEHVGFAAATTLYASFGIVCTLAILLYWRNYLWPLSAAVNRP